MPLFNTKCLIIILNDEFFFKTKSKAALSDDKRELMLMSALAIGFKVILSSVTRKEDYSLPFG